jgi:formate-dependent nitrite reductase membrane component NrfD
MSIDITTPALLFPAISLLLLAYTNRFLAIATLIRNLNKQHKEFPEKKIITGQIANLRSRLTLIRNMQIFGVSSFFLCVLSMSMLFFSNPAWGNYFFGGSMLFLMISLGISLRELQISTRALNLELSGME